MGKSIHKNKNGCNAILGYLICAETAVMALLIIVFINKKCCYYPVKLSRMYSVFQRSSFVITK